MIDFNLLSDIGQKKIIRTIAKKELTKSQRGGYNTDEV